MKKKIQYYENEKLMEKEISYIPFHYILAIFSMVLSTLAVMAIVFILSYYVRYFYILSVITQLVCILRIINAEDNPEYKIPWLVFVMLVPIVGYMSYFMFYSRKLTKGQLKKMEKIKEALPKGDADLNGLSLELSCGILRVLCRQADTKVYKNTEITYYALGEDMMTAILSDLASARQFIFLEYFILEEGIFWNAILKILRQKVKEGVEVRLLYDDIGCMTTLPGNYDKKLRKEGIQTRIFSKLLGKANNEFNNRSHRKILIIDNQVGYTGGINIADEYINQKKKYGHWKDGGVRLSGEAVAELTKLFLQDYELNGKCRSYDFSKYFPLCSKSSAEGYVIPFGDGPKPIYRYDIGKTLIMNLLQQARRYIYITTPYLIIDNELLQAIENASLKGVDVRIITPHIPDKRLVFLMTRSHYGRLLEHGVKIYEYEPGFIHFKSIISDDEYALISTINLDYRSLVHHFENGVLLYRSPVIPEIKEDIQHTISVSIPIDKSPLKNNLFYRLLKSLIKIFSPLL